jgi:hypothetical protein
MSKKFSELPAGTTPLAGTEIFAASQSGASKRFTAAELLAYIEEGLLDTDATLAANSDTKAASQAAIKAYVDALLNGLIWKQSVRVATTAAGTLATSFENGDTVDGVALAAGNRILIKNQAAGAENGIYVVAASGAPTRASDANSGAELVNATCYVSEGTVNADTQWTCSTNATIVVDTTPLTFAQLTSGGGVSLSAVNVWTKNQAVAPVTLSDGANIATDASLSNSFKVTLGGNRTFDNPTNLSDGMILNYVIKQDATGSRIPTFGSKFKWGKAGTGSMPTFSTAANAVNFCTFYYDSAADLLYGAMLDSITPATEPVLIQVAVGDETTAITTGAGKVTFRTPFAFTLTAVRASVNTAPTGAAILIDINESGTTVLSTKLMIDATEKTSTTAATPYVISDSAIADDAEISIDFDQVGSTIAGAGVKVTLIGTRPA